MKKTLLFGILCFVALAVNAQYVDLGLTSGTLWRDANEPGYNAQNALADVEEDIPTRKQWEELIKECEWTWQGDAYSVKGPNGKMIAFPVEGFRNFVDEANIEGESKIGYYWTADQAKQQEGYYVYIDAKTKEIRTFDNRNGLCVRLVMSAEKAKALAKEKATSTEGKK